MNGIERTKAGCDRFRVNGFLGLVLFYTTLEALSDICRTVALVVMLTHRCDILFPVRHYPTFHA